MAHWLRDKGFEAYAVRGGVAALDGLAPAAALQPEPAIPARRALVALAQPLFRRYSLGVLVSFTGNWLEAAAYGYVVLLLGGSAATLGVIGFLNTIPNLIWALPRARSPTGTTGGCCCSCFRARTCSSPSRSPCSGRPAR